MKDGSSALVFHLCIMTVFSTDFYISMCFISQALSHSGFLDCGTRLVKEETRMLLCSEEVTIISF